MPVPIRCVSLTRSLDRRAKFKAHMDALGLAFTFFDAVDGRTLSEDALAALAPQRRAYFSLPLTRGEIGCFLSHRGVYQEILASGAPLTVVLEDDAGVAGDFARLIEDIAALPSFDLVWLCGGPKGKRYRHARRLASGYELVRPFETKSTTQGYVISRVGAQKLAAHCARVTDPIDIAVKRYWAFGGDVFNVMPAACADLPEGGPSTIDGRIVAAPGQKSRAIGLTPLGALRRNTDELRKAGSFAVRVLKDSLRRAKAG